MLRRWAFVSVLVSVLLVAVMLSMRVQPLDNQIAEFFVPPQGCVAPCWQGIRPGETTFDEARAILEAHTWVDEVQVEASYYQLRWTWSGSQPSFVTTNNAPIVYANPRDGVDIVWSVFIPVDLALGHYQLALGPPDVVHARNPFSSGPQHSVVMYIGEHLYPEGRQRHVYRRDCPLTPSTVQWEVRVESIQIDAYAQNLQLNDTYDRSALFNPFLCTPMPAMT